MALVVPNSGEQLMIKLITGNIVHSNTTNLVAKLYTNNVTPNERSNSTSFTEASFSGYANVKLPGGSWIVSTNTISNTTSATYSSISFVLNGTQPNNISVYGYYVTFGNSGEVLWADRFPSAPVLLKNDQDQIQFAPYIEID